MPNPQTSSRYNENDNNNDTMLFNPAELDWFRHAPSTIDAKPAVEVIFEAQPPSSGLWWREILTELD